MNNLITANDAQTFEYVSKIIGLAVLQVFESEGFHNEELEKYSQKRTCNVGNVNESFLSHLHPYRMVDF